MAGFALFALALPFAAFAVFRLFKRTGHGRGYVFVAGVTFCLLVLSSLAATGGFMGILFFQPVAHAQIISISVSVMLVCVFSTTIMVVLLSFKDWPRGGAGP